MPSCRRWGVAGVYSYTIGWGCHCSPLPGADMARQCQVCLPVPALSGRCAPAPPSPQHVVSPLCYWGAAEILSISCPPPTILQP